MKKNTAILIFIFFIFLAMGQHSLHAQKSKHKTDTTKAATKYEMANAEYLLIEAQKFYLLEDYERALAFLEQSIETDPKNHAAYFKMGEIFLIEKKFEKGLRSIKKAQEIKPENKFYYILAAQLYKAQNNLQAAVSEYELMVRNAKGYREYLLDMADIYVALANYDKAIEMLNLTEDQYNTPRKFTIQKKELLIQAGKKKEATALLKDLTERFPQNQSYKIEYANLLAASGKNEQAEKILQLSEGSASSNLLLIDLKFEEGDFEAAKPLIEEVINNEDADLDVKLNLMAKLSAARANDISLSFIEEQQKKLYSIYPNDVAVIKSGEQTYSALAAKASDDQKPIYDQQVLVALNKLKDLNPSDYEVWSQLLIRAYEQKAWDALLINSEDALSYFPNQGLFYFYYANASFYSNKGDKEEVDFAFDQAIRLTRNDKELQGKIETAKLVFSMENEGIQVVEVPILTKASNDPQQSDALGLILSYVSTHNDQKTTQAALSTLNNLIEKKPKDNELFETKALILFQIGSFVESKNVLESFIKANPNEVTGRTLETLGDALFQLGQADDALEQWKKAKKLGNTSDKIDKKIAEKRYY